MCDPYGMNTKCQGFSRVSTTKGVLQMCHRPVGRGAATYVLRENFDDSHIVRVY